MIEQEFFFRRMTSGEISSKVEDFQKILDSARQNPYGKGRIVPFLRKIGGRMDPITSTNLYRTGSMLRDLELQKEAQNNDQLFNSIVSLWSSINAFLSEFGEEGAYHLPISGNPQDETTERGGRQILTYGNDDPGLPWGRF